jgi:hypothetical protein
MGLMVLISHSQTIKYTTTYIEEAIKGHKCANHHAQPIDNIQTMTNDCD